MNDKTTLTAQGRQLINLKEDDEVRDWCRSLGCTQEQLRSAVDAVGHPVKAVREHLSSK
jgi:hypothetical protein